LPASSILVSVAQERWQVSANISLNRGLNPFKLVRQKQVFANVMVLHHHVHWQNWSFGIVCFMETLLLTNNKPE